MLKQEDMKFTPIKITDRMYKASAGSMPDAQVALPKGVGFQVLEMGSQLQHSRQRSLSRKKQLYEVGTSSCRYHSKTIWAYSLDEAIRSLEEQPQRSHRCACCHLVTVGGVQKGGHDEALDVFNTGHSPTRHCL
jgi:hypothetical protein